ncbi:isoprenyl transferase [Paenibacillus marinisediminis]
MIKRIQKWLRPSELKSDSAPLSLNNIPKHVAIIMDGNGRWAKTRGLPRVAGHHSGMKAVKRVTIAANELGIKVLTMYAFSTENWTRPKEEVDFLMKLPQQFLAIELDDLIANNVQVRMMGYRDQLPSHTLDALEEAIEKTKHNTGLILNFALNYGGQREIVESVRAVAQDVQAGKLKLEDINEETIESKLLSSDLPNPDLLIRTSGELRLSNFMLWQLAYSELWFSDIYWPEFNGSHLREAVAEYQRRTRRYGGLQ